jgi:predicted small integral membrane protein
MNRLFYILFFLILRVIGGSWYGNNGSRRWSHLFIVLALMLLIARIIWVAVKG